MAFSPMPRARDAEPPLAQAARIAKALGHPARMRIVWMLLERRSCIGCDIVDEVGLAQSTVSEHLRILKTAGVITGEIEHPRVCYALNRDALAPLAIVLDAAGGQDGEGHAAGPSGRPASIRPA